LRELPSPARASYALLINGPYIAGLLAGLGAHAPIPFNLGVSNVPGPTAPLYWNGSRLDALYPLSLLLHGNALNITCVSYAGTLNFGVTGPCDREAARAAIGGDGVDPQHTPGRRVFDGDRHAGGSAQKTPASPRVN